VSLPCLSDSKFQSEFSRLRSVADQQDNLQRQDRLQQPSKFSRQKFHIFFSSLIFEISLQKAMQDLV
jgi:hypothetical protein